MARYKKILAALDGGETRLAVARRALSLAHDNEADVLFVHVIEKVELEHAAVSIEKVLDRGQKVLEEELDRQLSRAMHDDKIPSVEVLVEAGRISETLEEKAREFEPELVVCGARGLSDLKYAFVGSVSTDLIRHMPCDVLVVHPGAIDDIDEAEYEQAEKAAGEA